MTCPNLVPDPFAIDTMKLDVGRLGALGSFEEAVALMRHIQALEPSVEYDIAREVRKLTIESILNNGITLAQEGVFEEAYLQYLHVQNFDGFDASDNYAIFLENICYIGGTLETAERALSLCNASIQNNSEDKFLYEARAKINAWLDDFEGAIDDLERAIELISKDEISEDAQERIDLWQDWVSQLEIGVNPFVESPPN
ncbi:MAG: hypothetical protein HC806_10385 [Anaerolineae bacterium]|nr:hypothetical protein [Anaerolineae bacterium]